MTEAWLGLRMDTLLCGLVLIRHYGWRAEAAFGKFKSDGKEACFSAGTISYWTTYLGKRGWLGLSSEVSPA